MRRSLSLCGIIKSPPIPIPILITKRFINLSNSNQNLPHYKSTKTSKVNSSTINYDDYLGNENDQGGSIDSDVMDWEDFGFTEESLLAAEMEGFTFTAKNYQDKYEDMMNSHASEDYAEDNGGNDSIWAELDGFGQLQEKKVPTKSLLERVKRIKKNPLVMSKGSNFSRPHVPQVRTPSYDPEPLSELTLSQNSPLSPYRPINLPPSFPFPQPHEIPLRSRFDWRLSSRVLFRSNNEPTDLRQEQPNLIRAGHNRLIGVGPDCSREDRRRMRTKYEIWSTKYPMPFSSLGTEWESANRYIIKQMRLLDLTAIAEEKVYLTELNKLGSPNQRFKTGKTIPRAIGLWAGDAAANDKALQAVKLRAERLAAEHDEERGYNAAIAGLDQIKSSVSIWSSSTIGRVITEDDFPSFTPDTTLRFTPLSATSTRPIRANSGPNYYQGRLLEIKDGKLIVSFDEMFDIEGVFRIDIGRDESSRKLQIAAMKNLYFDPTIQRNHNIEQVEGVQRAFTTRAEVPELQQWVLKGTDIRELVIPDLIDDASYYNPIRNEDLDYRPLIDDSLLAAELTNGLKPTQTTSQNPSSMFSDNQLINSWIKRYRRETPLIMPGDPFLGLNPSQMRAVAMALDESISLIQGPPGTGKSQTIVSIIKLLKVGFRHPSPILLAAPTHVAVDHLLSSLVTEGLNPLRTGKASKVRPELREWTIEKRREKHPLWPQLEAVRERTETLRVETQRLNELLAKSTGSEVNQATEEGLEEELQEAKKLYRSSYGRLQALNNRLYSSLLATADVFVTTALGAGRSKVVDYIDFPIVFIDEAAMCTEPVTLIPLMKGASHVTLIGDHMQLPAVMTSKEAKLEKLHVSMFERLMNSKKVNSVLLSTQYRMRPIISEFPNRAFYLSALSDSASVFSRPPPPKSRYFNTLSNAAVHSPNVFINHTNTESMQDSSTINKGEVNIIVDIVGDLLKQNPGLQAEDIGVITFYAAQTRLLSSTFKYDAASTLYSLLGPDRANSVSNVEVNTVDGFQGREKSIIILSTVRSNAGGRIGFLNDKRRLNVALTRAKNGLFVVGNRRTLKMATESAWYRIEKDQDADSDIWRRYLKWVEENGLSRTWQEKKLEKVMFVED